jgi:hypothetical protein
MQLFEERQHGRGGGLWEPIVHKQVNPEPSRERACIEPLFWRTNNNNKKRKMKNEKENLDALARSPRAS